MKLLRISSKHEVRQAQCKARKGKSELNQVLYRLLPYMRPYRGRIALHVVLLAAIALLELLNPWPIKFVIDSVLGNHPLPEAFRVLLPGQTGEDKFFLLIMAVAAGFGLRLLISGLKIPETHLNIDLRQRTALALKSDLFQHLQRQSFVFHDNRRVGDSIYRVSDDAYCVDNILSSLPSLLASSLTLMGMFSIVMHIDWQLALLSSAVVPLLYYCVCYYCKRILPKVHRILEMEGESMAIVQETLSNLRVVKAFVREKYQHDRFLKQGQSIMNERIRVTVQQVMFSVTVGIITVAGSSFVLGVGAYHVLRGSLTVGELLVVLAYLGSIYTPLESISGTLTFIQQYFAKAERVFEVLDTDPDVKDTAGAVPLTSATGKVTFEMVNFGYKKGADILRDINLDVEPGQVIGIVGPTGAGKTTLVSLIPRFYDVTSGRVLIGGLEVRKIQLESLRRNVSLVFQDPVLFSGTIRENISYGKLNATFGEIVEAAKAANAHNFIMRLPDRYETEVGERGVKLSGGEKQRVSIARAFLKDAPILILDEPTSSMDSKTEAVILEALERLMRGRTTFIIAHRLSTVRRVDLLVVLLAGKIVEKGTFTELMRREGVFASLYHTQFSTQEEIRRVVS